MPKINIQELEREVETNLENIGLILEANIHGGNLTNPEDFPSIKYRIRQGQEKEVGELKKSIISLLLQNTSEGIRIQSDYDEKTQIYTDKLILNPNTKFDPRGELKFRYHILYTIRKEISNFCNKGKRRHR